VETNTIPTQERITVPIAEFEKLTAERDESPIKGQDKIKKKITYRGFMWVYRNPI
jgi:hypothetical protein|tara:strand:- start:754 stop:918 length:165 start_codon:yes stop_codon:yes gene_type:complete